MRRNNKVDFGGSTFTAHQGRLWCILSFLDPFIEEKEYLNILDVGGTELSESVLSRKFPGSKITVFNARSKPARRFVLGDAQQMPFKADTFDLLVSIELIEHVYAPHRVFAEAYRVGRPNSLVLVTTPNMNAWYNRILVPLGSMPPNYTVVPYRQYGTLLSRGPGYSTGQDHCRVFNLRALAQAMEEHGFDIRRSFGLNYTEAGHRFSALRKFMALLMPKTLCENIGVVAHKIASAEMSEKGDQ